MSFVCISPNRSSTNIWFGTILSVVLLVSRLWTLLNVLLGLLTDCALGLCLWKLADDVSLLWGDSRCTENRWRELLRSPGETVTEEATSRWSAPPQMLLWPLPDDSWSTRGREGLSLPWLPFASPTSKLPSSVGAYFSIKELPLESCWHVTQVSSGASS